MPSMWSPWDHRASEKVTCSLRWRMTWCNKATPCCGPPSTAQLMQRLLAAKRDLRLPQELVKLHRYACLLLDDIGYVQHDQDEMEVLFTLLSDRYEQRSICLSTNLVFSEWERIFKNPLTTVAAIDRVVHHSVILDLMQVRNFRIQQATGQHEQELPARS
jgi:DNA replication protein DnaC